VEISSGALIAFSSGSCVYVVNKFIQQSNPVESHVLRDTTIFFAVNTSDPIKRYYFPKQYKPAGHRNGKEILYVFCEVGTEFLTLFKLTLCFNVHCTIQRLRLKRPVELGSCV
jgi:hypothetical protein